MNEHSIREIARVCHEINRAYCKAIGDHSQSEWDEAPDWQQDSAINGVRMHLEHYAERGDWPSPRDSHISWLNEKAATGWKYGPVKDADKKEHPCFMAYDDLPEAQRVKDFLFGATIKALANSERLL